MNGNLRFAIIALTITTLVISPAVAINIGTPVFKDQPLPVVKTYTDADGEIGLIDSILNIIGMHTDTKFITITNNGKPLGTVPIGSKFADIPIHESCLMFGFGTENFYNCEVTQ